MGFPTLIGKKKNWKRAKTIKKANTHKTDLEETEIQEKILL